MGQSHSHKINSHSSSTRNPPSTDVPIRFINMLKNIIILVLLHKIVNFAKFACSDVLKRVRN